MFVIPTDSNGAILRPSIIGLVDNKNKKPIRTAKLTLPPGLNITPIDFTIDKPKIARPTQYPPCIAKILQNQHRVNEVKQPERMSISSLLR